MSHDWKRADFMRALYETSRRATTVPAMNNEYSTGSNDDFVRRWAAMQAEVHRSADEELKRWAATTATVTPIDWMTLLSPQEIEDICFQHASGKHSTPVALCPLC